MILALLLAATAASPDIPMLVSTAWLAEHRNDPKLVILQIGDARSKPAYDQGHIPGAQFMNPFRELAAPHVEGGLALELPPEAQLDSVLEAHGISNDSYVVLVHAGEYFSPTSRTFLTLEYAGLGGRISILDGGLELWKTEGRPVSTDVPTPARSSFKLALHPNVVVDANWVRDHLTDQKVRILDARDSTFYYGADAHQARSGRIPGAASMPFGSVIAEGGKFKALSTLRSQFEAAGVKPSDTVVSYCHIGQQASLIWYTARLLGYKAALYDGSFQDWSARSDLPVVTGH
ncbi:MAG: sulfurtransferase [Gemmatimonadota bacterium]